MSDVTLPNDWLEIRFWATLIKVTSTPTTEQQRALDGNCTHVTGPYWIMEGETEYLKWTGLRFREIAEGSVGCLGDFNEAEMKQVCRERFRVEL